MEAPRVIADAVRAKTCELPHPISPRATPLNPYWVIFCPVKSERSGPKTL